MTTTIFFVLHGAKGVELVVRGIEHRNEHLIATQRIEPIGNLALGLPDKLVGAQELVFEEILSDWRRVFQVLGIGQRFGVADFAQRIER
ncbi:MAG: hypothetical protein IKE66_06625 [Hyphomicrobium sp.]|nr:hypothetical protein [Hyphomicrobium sp.]